MSLCIVVLHKNRIDSYYLIHDCDNSSDSFSEVFNSAVRDTEYMLKCSNYLTDMYSYKIGINYILSFFIVRV